MLHDGTPNRYRIVRLKDKLGTRSMASGEVAMDGALAYPLGHLDAGFKQMAEMINWSRLSNGVKSTALMRRAMHDAWQVYRHRRVFGRQLLDLPLAQRQLLKLQLPAEQALLVVEIAKRQNRLFGGTEDFLVTRELREIATDDQRSRMLDCLFAVAAADDVVSGAEEDEIRKISIELGFEHAEYIAARLKYTTQRSVFKNP